MIQEIVIAGVGALVGGWLLYYYGPQGLKAGRDLNIDISQSESQISKPPVLTAPVIRVASTKFGIYKPPHPQAPGQTKAWIQVRVVNDSNLHPAQQVHVRFLTDDGLVPKHRADSDEWNTQQGTPSLYTFDLPPRGVVEVPPWRPDIPGVSKCFARPLVMSTLEGQTLYRDAFRMLGVSKLTTFQELGCSLGMAV